MQLLPINDSIIQVITETNVLDKMRHLQWRKDSQRSASVITVFPLNLWVTSSLQHPTSKYVFGNLKGRKKRQINIGCISGLMIQNDIGSLTCGQYSMHISCALSKSSIHVNRDGRSRPFMILHPTNGGLVSENDQSGQSSPSCVFYPSQN